MPAPGYGRAGYSDNNNKNNNNNNNDSNNNNNIGGHSKQQREEEHNSPVLELALRPELFAATSRGDEPYQYRTLNKNEIRLVNLWPGLADSPLRAIVYHATLENPGHYRALSYVWGNSDKPHSMWTPDGRIPLTWSLDAALRRIRHPTEPFVLWVDAVCIN